MNRLLTFILMGGAAFAATPEQNWLNKVYQDLLNRPADAAAMQAFLPQAGTQAGRQQIVGVITASNEYRTDLVGSMYSQYLKRTASPADVSPLVAAFVTDEQARATIIGSPEYFQVRAGNSVSQFITAMYNDLLNRAPSSQDIAIFSLFIANQGRVSATLVVLGSDEYRGKLAAADYVRFLGRAIDPGAANAALQFFRNGGTDEQYLGILLSSGEYFGSAQNSNGVEVTARFSQGSAVAYHAAANGAANLLVQVADLASGNPIDGLTQSQFKLTGHFQLPGQSCGFSSNGIAGFAGVGNGWYQMTVGLPASRDLCQWVAGDYLANIVVQNGRQGATVATLNIQ